MSLTLEKIFEAKNRIAPYTTRTPLIRLEKLDEYLGCQVYLKAECMQITGAFKLRGAVNKIRMLTPEQLSCGIVAASSGNHGKAVAYTAKKLGAKATIVMPYTAPAIKVNAIKELGAEVVQCETSERFDVAERICREKNATMVPPYNDEEIMAGQGTAGIEILERRLYKLKRDLAIDLTIINGENSAVGNGVNRASYQRLIRLGADVVTGGNHSFQQKGCTSLYDEAETLLRPANFPEGVSGRGSCIVDVFPVKIAVISLMGTVGLEALDNPFFCVDKLIEEADTPNIFVDFHAEATSEKKAMGQYLAGRVTGVFGTHTHVQTADETILGGHTAYITDVGMTGPELSVLGVDTEIAIQKMKYHCPVTFKISENPAFINAVAVEFDEKLGKANKIERIIMR